MNGFKRASRRQAAIVGLAVLMGASFLGCHTGPRLFSKKDRDERAAKKELAEKDSDKSKFINRKKVRPESDYRDDSDEKVAKSDSKSKTKPSDVVRKSSNEPVERAVVSRPRPDDANGSTSRSAKATASQPKTSKSSDRTDIARKDTNQRPVTDLLNEDSLFDEKLPETRSVAKAAATPNPSARSTAVKTKSLDEDPFKNSVIGPTNAKRSEKTVATVNFLDDEDLDDEMEEEAEELESLHASAAKTIAAKTAIASDSIQRRATSSAIPSKRKFLDDVDEPADGSFRSLISNEDSETSIGDTIVPSDERIVKRTVDTAKTVAGQKVIDRRQQVQQTLNDWRRELDRDESLMESEEEAKIPMPKVSSRPNATSTARGHISQTSIEEFTPPAKSQGAVLNGELIIDTKTLPSRFQRTSENPSDASNPNGAAVRVNSNSGANIDIVPGATQNRARSAGQITLQSGAEENATTGLTTAGFEQASDLGKLPSLNLDAEVGPKLSALDEETEIAPAPPEELPASTVGIGLEESSGSRGWKRALLVFAAMASAVVIGFALRRRMELTPESIRVPKQPAHNPQDPASWPRG